MGYEVRGHGSIVVKKENLDKCYEALMELNNAPDEAKNGGAWSNGGYTARWFSWMPADLRTLPDTKAVFAELGFEVQDEENGDLRVYSYSSKTGQEEVFFSAAAPFIENGGEFYWEGEDGLLWKWEFRGGKMMFLDGVVEYQAEREYTLPQALREHLT